MISPLVTNPHLEFLNLGPYRIDKPPNLRISFDQRILTFLENKKTDQIFRFIFIMLAGIGLTGVGIHDGGYLEFF